MTWIVVWILSTSALFWQMSVWAAGLTCENGRYGVDCTEYCHCENDAVCDKATGRCTGACDIMWSGESCSKSRSLTYTITRNITTTQVRDYYSLNASLAIDGMQNYSIDVCRCCSVAEAIGVGTIVWWQIDLGQKYLIDAVSLYGRSDGAYQQQIEGAKVSAGNLSLSSNSSAGSVIYTVPLNIGQKYHFVQMLNPEVIARYFIVRITNNLNILTLCEFLLREKAYCSIGFFGIECLHKCHCKNGTRCNSVTGHCEVGACEPGWQGPACDRTCEDGRYGVDCTEYCHCENDAVCDKATGRCTGACDIMWSGESCSKSRSLTYTIARNITTTQVRDYYSYNASLAIDGMQNYPIDVCRCCSVAEAIGVGTIVWWQIDLGQKYLIDAVSLYGRSDGGYQQQIEGAKVSAGNLSLSSNSSAGSVIYTVPLNISKNYHFVQMLNPEVIARYFIVRITNAHNILTLCEFLLREKDCSIGFFGIECLHKCHCKNGTRCNSVTGHCEVGACEPGWQGSACDRKCDQPTLSANGSRDDAISTTL